MKNACESQNDNGQFQEKGDVVLPTLEVWRLGFDCKSFLGVSAMLWNTFEALKHLLTRFSVFNILSKNAMLFYGFERIFFVSMP